MKFCSVRSVTTSKCTARVLAQVNKHMYTFCSPSELRTNNAPVKSTPVTLNGSEQMAVIENLIKGNDGYVRAAEVRTSSGRTNRPIARLYPLEITSEVVNPDPINNEDDHQQSTDPVDELIMRERPIRSTAAKARQNISRWSKEILGPAPEDVEN